MTLKVTPGDRAVLEEARRILQRGWCQNTTRRDGKRCLLAALEDAHDRVHRTLPTTSFLPHRWAKLLGLQPTRIVEWNDAPERTHAEVLERFDRALGTRTQLVVSAHERPNLVHGGRPSKDKK